MNNYLITAAILLLLGFGIMVLEPLTMYCYGIWFFASIFAVVGFSKLDKIIKSYKNEQK